MLSILSFKFIIVIALSNAFIKKIQDTFLKFLVDFFIKISYIQEIIFDDINNYTVLHVVTYSTCKPTQTEFHVETHIGKAHCL